MNLTTAAAATAPARPQFCQTSCPATCRTTCNAYVQATALYSSTLNAELERRRFQRRNPPPLPKRMQLRDADAHAYCASPVALDNPHVADLPVVRANYRRGVTIHDGSFAVSAQLESTAGDTVIVQRIEAQGFLENNRDPKLIHRTPGLSFAVAENCIGELRLICLGTNGNRIDYCALMAARYTAQITIGSAVEPAPTDVVALAATAAKDGHAQLSARLLAAALDGYVIDNSTTPDSTVRIYDPRHLTT